MRREREIKGLKREIKILKLTQRITEEQESGRADNVDMTDHQVADIATSMVQGPSAAAARRRLAMRPRGESEGDGDLPR